VLEQDDGGQRPVNIPADTEQQSSGDADPGGGSTTLEQLRNSLRSLDEMKTRFVEERNQWNAERDQLKTTVTEVGSSEAPDATRLDVLFSGRNQTNIETVDGVYDKII